MLLLCDDNCLDVGSMQDATQGGTSASKSGCMRGATVAERQDIMAREQYLEMVEENLVFGGNEAMLGKTQHMYIQRQNENSQSAHADCAVCKTRNVMQKSKNSPRWSA